MADLLFVLVLVGLFAVTAGFVQLCDRMIGSADDAPIAVPASEASEQVAA